MFFLCLPLQRAQQVWAGLDLHPQRGLVPNLRDLVVIRGVPEAEFEGKNRNIKNNLWFMNITQKKVYTFLTILKPKLFSDEISFDQIYIFRPAPVYARRLQAQAKTAGTDLYIRISHKTSSPTGCPRFFENRFKTFLIPI